MKYGFFIVVLLILLGGLSLVIGRGMQSLSHSPVVRTTYGIVMALLFVCLILSFLLPAHLSPTVTKGFSFVGYSFLIILLYTLFALLIIDAIRVANHFFHFIEDISVFRFRSFVISWIVIGIIMAVGNYRFRHPQRVELEITSGKPLQNRELKIVAVSDIHLGQSIIKKDLQRYVSLINAEHPDLVLIGGDLIDRSIEAVMHQNMDEELRAIKAPMGVYAVLGNHEYFTGNLKAVRQFYQKSNIQLLRDSIVSVGDLTLIGRDDHSNRERTSLEALLKKSNPSHPILLLDHQPHNLSQTEQSYVDFQFSGHTHEGQIFPGNLIVKRLFELPYGYLQKGNAHIYTSSGLGIWGPQYRIGTRSEYVVIRFRY